MYVKRIFFLSLITLFVCFQFVDLVQAISIPGQIPELEEQVSVIVEPELPSPNEKVNIKVEAYGTDLTRAFITWKVNNVIKKSGRGEQMFELNSGPVGTAQTVVISIQPTGGPVITKQLFFKPQEVDLLWEARSYTPPFYKGKALPGFMGESIVVAIPTFTNGQTVTLPKNTTFKWKKDYEVQNDESGFMKNSMIVKGGILLKPEEIQIEATDDFGNKAKQTISYEYVEPSAFFYEKSPLYGILFNKKINSASIKNKELGLITIPYFFETSSRSGLNYTWKVNGSESFLFSKDYAVFRYSGEDGGTSIIDVDVKSPDNFLQEASTRASLNLEKSKTPSIEF